MFGNPETTPRKRPKVFFVSPLTSGELRNLNKEHWEPRASRLSKQSCSPVQAGGTWYVQSGIASFADTSYRRKVWRSWKGSWFQYGGRWGREWKLHASILKEIQMHCKNHCRNKRKASLEICRKLPDVHLTVPWRNVGDFSLIYILCCVNGRSPAMRACFMALATRCWCLSSCPLAWRDFILMRRKFLSRVTSLKSKHQCRLSKITLLALIAFVLLFWVFVYKPCQFYLRTKWLVINWAPKFLICKIGRVRFCVQEMFTSFLGKALKRYIWNVISSVCSIIGIFVFNAVSPDCSVWRGCPSVCGDWPPTSARWTKPRRLSRCGIFVPSCASQLVWILPSISTIFLLKDILRR